MAEHSARNSSGNWTDELGRYDEVITGYDFNGNIISLTRADSKTSRPRPSAPSMTWHTRTITETDC